MRRLLWAVAAFGILAAMWTMPAAAAKSFDETALVGSYSFTSIQMRRGEEGEDPIVYCSGYGTIEFRGDGTAWIDGTERCSNDGIADTYSSERFYLVDDEPDFRIEEQDDDGVFWTHCRLLRKGEIILCDGTLREPDMLAFQAIAVME